MTVGPLPSVKTRVPPALPMTGASLTAVMVTVEVAAEEELVPSFTTQEMVRFAVLGLSEVLL